MEKPESSVPNQPVSREELRALIDAGWKPDFVFFWGHTPRDDGELGRECLSQWYPVTFVLGGETFRSAEHYMMYRKARLFDDDAAAARVLDAAGPAEAKKIGRAVRGFDETTWRTNRFQIVVDASVAKFGQNPALGSFLLATGDAVLVEASPRDTIWGIGLGVSNPRARDPARWRGLNLLGFALMRARRALAR